MQHTFQRTRRLVETLAFSILAAAVLSGATKSDVATATPIQHLVVIFQENVSFDHYFATYPNALNPPGEPSFSANADTPTVNGLAGALLTQNPNSAQPFRLSRLQQLTCDQQHDYTPEQRAMNAGLMDKFVEFTGRTRPTSPLCEFGLGKNVVMGYYDGNTATALWNYAQHFAMSDNFFETTFGPSTPGAVNLISGQTHGLNVVLDTGNLNTQVVDGTMIGNPRPALEDCLTSGKNLVTLTGRNIGDLLNQKDITWGWFQGGFRPTGRNPDGSAICGANHTTVGGFASFDYVPHHQPFQYYPQTANPHHLPPTSIDMIGQTDQAKHQYDLADFWAAARAGNLPAVSFLKAPSYQDGHSENSDPLDEQTFIVNTINALQQLPQWRQTAVIITYDDSDGWYDHVMPPIVSQSNTAADALTGAGSCGLAPPGAYQGRCGYGPRLPLLVVSPWAKVNFVDHVTTDQTSILRLIEDNWNLGRIGDQSFDEKAGSMLNMFDFTQGHRAKKVFLDANTGLIETTGESDE